MKKKLNTAESTSRQRTISNNRKRAFTCLRFILTNGTPRQRQAVTWFISQAFDYVRVQRAHTKSGAQ